MKRSALGRGLSALISDADNLNVNRAGESVTPASISEIEIELIEVNPFQPRESFDPESLQELAQSITLLGLIQPITVREIEGGKYQIISGERRFRAAALANLKRVPAYVRSADDQGMLEMALVENIQRKDLDAIEIALSFQRLIEECSLTQEEMADRVGKKRATVTNYLRLLRLPAEIQLALRAGKISMGHARALLAVESPKRQLKLCNDIIERALSVRAIEEKIRKESSRERSLALAKEEQEESFGEPYYKVLDFLGRYFNNNIALKRDPKKEGGTITIRFKNDTEVESFLEAIERKKL